MERRVGDERRKYRVSPVEGVSEYRSWIEEFRPDVGVAALRIAIASLILTHALREFFGMLLGATPWMGAPGVFTDRWIAATLVAGCGLLIVAGWFTRAAATALAAIVVFSWFAPDEMRGHWQVGSIELIATYVSVLLVIVLIGPGYFSIDAWRAGRFKARKSTRNAMKVAMSPWIKSQYRRSRLSR